MKRGIIIGLAVLMTIILVSFILNTYLEKQRNFGKYKTMNDFSFSTLYNEVQNTSTLPKYKGYVVQIFSTECGICKDEANEYHNHNDSMQNILFIMLSIDSIAKIKEFALKQQLYNTDNFIFGHIEKKVIEANFGSVIGPSLFIYNSEKELISKEVIANSATLLNYFEKGER
ncbi:MAG: peroxiredoxin family protein [Mariniphaga sp.]|nr:peroxiredoxin family protein [Mariniphaga sp.]